MQTGLNKMKSYWMSQYVGSHNNILIKKLERLLGISALDKQIERIILDGKKIEQADFFIEHEVDDWVGLVYGLIELSGRLSMDVNLHGDMSSEINGVIDISKSTGSLDRPSGLLTIQWQIKRDQNYRRLSYLSRDQKQMW
jgi:hypothetical protein